MGGGEGGVGWGGEGVGMGGMGEEVGRGWGTCPLFLFFFFFVSSSQGCLSLAQCSTTPSEKSCDLTAATRGGNMACGFFLARQFTKIAFCENWQLFCMLAAI